MTGLLTAIHIIICFILIVAVLLQSGKSADLAGAFGGAGSQTVFGARGAATILTKVTTICAILFMFTSIGLWILSATGTKSVVSGEEATQPEATSVTETEKKETQAPAAGEKQQPPEKKDKEEAKKEPKGENPSQ